MPLAATWIMVAHEVALSSTVGCRANQGSDTSREGSTILSLRMPCNGSSEPRKFCPGQFVRCGGHLRVAGDVKEILQRSFVEGLLQQWNVGIAGLDAFHSISRDKHDGHPLRAQKIGDRINQLTSEVDIQDGGVEMRVTRRSHGLGKGPVGTDYAKPQLG